MLRIRRGLRRGLRGIGILPILAVFILWPLPANAQADEMAAPVGTETASLSAEPYLNPAGCPTADVLRQNEMMFSVWGWGAYGITDDLTILFDWNLAFAKIPYAYLRYHLPLNAGGFSHAVEVLGVYMNNGQEDFLAGQTPAFEIRQKGWTGWVHWNTTYQWTGDLRLHASIGGTYDSYQKYTPRGEANFTGDKVYQNYGNLDLALGAEYSPWKYLRLSFNVVSGNEFFIYDQAPQRWAMQMGVQVAPFIDWKWKIFSALRIEFWGYYVRFPELSYEEKLPVPVFPLVMWQWQW